MAGYTDTSELDALVKDLRRAPRGAIRQMRQCVRKGAINIKRDARQTIKGLMSGKSAIRYYPTSITYDFIATGKKIYAEIGPETGKQGSLGHLLEFGTATSPAMPHLIPAFEKEYKEFVTHMSKVAKPW